MIWRYTSNACPTHRTEVASCEFVLPPVTPVLLLLMQPGSNEGPVSCLMVLVGYKPQIMKNQHPRLQNNAIFGYTMLFFLISRYFLGRRLVNRMVLGSMLLVTVC